MPKKTQNTAHVSRALVAALIGVIAIPTAITGLFQSIDDDGINTVPVIDLRHRALNDASRVRYVRRNYWRAVGIYNELVRLGVEDLSPPDINDNDSINYYLDPENFAAVEGFGATVHAAAPLGEGDGYVSSISEAQREYNNLAERYRDLLDGYMTTRFCPGTLRQYHLAGFYELCNTLLDEHIAGLQPSLLERSSYLRGFNSVGFAPLRTLRNRLEVLEESLIYEGGTSVRPRTHSGFRPRPDYSDLRTGR
jgi:hypothetical protein|tara:strand:- start:39030 stop:39782 length:753 start_codon:yes stop_codon:yes gene_type:complete